jgi:hypothetical protein
MEASPDMNASNRHRLLLHAIGALAGISIWGAIAATGLAEVPSVYFPATTAYYRHNYDPFDQPTTSVGEVRSEENGDIQLSSEIHLLSAERFEHVAAGPANQVIPVAMQAVPQATTETLPPPVSSGGTDEPGADWAPKPLEDLSTNIMLPGGVLPRDYWNERAPQHISFFDPCGQTRGWPVNTFNWVASCFCSNPLYFEEINLERYGYGCGCFGPCCSNCVQSVVSGAHFFANVVILPYKMGVDCPCDCDYTLGHYRPGSCPPWRYTCCTRCSALGAASAGGVATGLIFLIP